MFRRNPVYQKELRTDARAIRVFFLITIFNIILAAVAFIMFYSMVGASNITGELDYSGLIELYMLMSYIEFGIVILVLPVITAGAITGERERKTLDIMLVGGRHAGTIVMGKFMSSIQLILVTVVSSLPVLSIVFVYGGIKFENIIELLFVILVSGIYIGSMGIFCSSVCKKTTSAIITAYAVSVGVMMLTTGYNYFFSRMAVENAYVGSYQVLLFNPVATITQIISEQLDAANEFRDFLFIGVSEETLELVTDDWILYSTLVQLIVSAVLLILSTVMVNPLKFNFIRRLINGDRKKIAEN